MLAEDKFDDITPLYSSINLKPKKYKKSLLKDSHKKIVLKSGKKKLIRKTEVPISFKKKRFFKRTTEEEREILYLFEKVLFFIKTLLDFLR